MVGASRVGAHLLLLLLLLLNGPLCVRASWGWGGGGGEEEECDDSPSPAGVSKEVFNSRDNVLYSCPGGSAFSDGSTSKRLDCTDDDEMSTAASLECISKYLFNQTSSSF